MVSPELNSTQLLRMADASLNRMAEGLRYLEDVCRFVLNDTPLNQQLKDIRHEFVVTEWRHQKPLIESRNSVQDVGVNIEADGDKNVTRDLPSSIVANSRRVQEALRSLEETSKITRLTPRLTSAKFQQARFEMYTIEKEILGKLTRQEKARGIQGLYVVIDTQALKGKSHVDVTRQVINGGARMIQLRDKTMDRGTLLPIAREMNELCRQNNALFFINDYVDLALAVKADGIHLGQTDLPVKVARQMIPMDMLIGCSVNSVKLAQKAQADGADYIAVNGVYPTGSKENVHPLGVDIITKLKQKISLPVVAIGGINLGNIGELKAAGVNSIAVISAVLDADSPEAAARQLSEKFEEK